MSTEPNNRDVAYLLADAANDCEMTLAHISNVMDDHGAKIPPHLCIDGVVMLRAMLKQLNVYADHLDAAIAAPRPEWQRQPISQLEPRKTK